MKDNIFEVMEITEAAGWAAADLMNGLEAIHYDPEGFTEDDLLTLREIANLIEMAKEKAEWLEKSLHRKEQTR